MPGPGCCPSHFAASILRGHGRACVPAAPHRAEPHTLPQFLHFAAAARVFGEAAHPWLPLCSSPALRLSAGCWAFAWPSGDRARQAAPGELCCPSPCLNHRPPAGRPPGWCMQYCLNRNLRAAGRTSLCALSWTAALRTARVAWHSQLPSAAHSWQHAHVQWEWYHCTCKPFYYQHHWEGAG